MVSPSSPDRPHGAGLTLFLFHLARDGSHPATGEPNRTAPLPLVLRYQLSGHPPTDDDAGALEAQLLLGVAMRALHDHSIVTPDTLVNGVQVLDAVGIVDPRARLRVDLQPVSREEAVDWWAPGDRAMRLAAYYRVTAQIEAVEQMLSGPPVLEIGAPAIPASQPRLFGVEAEVTVSPPGRPPQQIAIKPAGAAVGDRLIFSGGGLEGGEVGLVLEHADWAAPERLTTEWGVLVAGGRLIATVAPMAGANRVLPGVYAARAEIVRQVMLPGGPRDLTVQSNTVPFSVTPAINQVVGPDAAGVVTLTGGMFAHGDIPESEVEVFLRGQPLGRVAAGPPGAGTFVVDAADTLRLAAHAGEPPGDVPIRVRVRGADSVPVWVTLP